MSAARLIGARAALVMLTFCAITLADSGGAQAQESPPVVCCVRGGAGGFGGAAVQGPTIEPVGRRMGA